MKVHVCGKRCIEKCWCLGTEFSLEQSADSVAQLLCIGLITRGNQYFLLNDMQEMQGK